MQWNLNDHLSGSNGRAFHLPVAGDPLGGTQLPNMEPDDFLIKDLVINNLRSLEVKVSIPTAGLPDQNGLPNPSIRLHAMCRGKMKYKPAFGTLQRCLLLFIPPIWPRVIEQVKWFERWLEAGCLPHLIIYENVDEAHLRQMLEAMDPNNHADNQILFPVQALGSDQAKIDFINRFLAGSDIDSVTVFPGTPIGKLNQDFVSPVFKTLRLHVRYADHTDAAPHAMHPRELFYLLFGQDSQEAQNHPLLRQLRRLGQQDTVTFPKTKRMLLRPPLRTHARVVWEADLELQEAPDDAHWSLVASLEENSFLNSVQDFDRSKTYKDVYKCTLFGFEVLLRSGFRVRMVRWSDALGVYVYYYRVNRLVREARDVQLSADKPGLLAYSGEAVWGRRWDAILNAKPVAEHAAEINRMMEEEGRCFYLIQEFDGPTCKDCSGHFMILNRVEESLPLDPKLQKMVEKPTVWWEVRGQASRGTTIGLNYIYANVYQALKAGLFNNTDIFFPEWKEYVQPKYRDMVTSDNDLLLIEAYPGKDPDNQQGIEDLCSIHERPQRGE